MDQEQVNYNILKSANQQGLTKMQYFPLNMKLSYNQRLDIQLFIRHQFQSQKFKRHWIFCQGYSPEQQNKILKTYLSFVKQGDLYKVKTSNYSGNWKQKTFENIVTLLEKQNFHNQTKKFKINLQKQVSSIQQSSLEKQYDQMIVVTIFMSESVNQKKVQDFSEFISSIDKSQVILNLFVPDQIAQKILPTKTWFRIYSTKDIKQQIRGLFSTLGKTGFKRITIALRCLDGDISINESTHYLAKNTWKTEISKDFQHEYISNTIYFPSSNLPYIISAEIKNMLKEEMCRFEMIMTYEDEEGKVGELSKIFSLKPTKEFLDWTDNSGTVNENQSLYKYQQLSLNFEEVNLNQKLNFMKIMGTPVRVVIKKGSEV